MKKKKKAWAKKAWARAKARVERRWDQELVLRTWQLPHASHLRSSMRTIVTGLSRLPLPSRSRLFRIKLATARAPIDQRQFNLDATDKTTAQGYEIPMVRVLTLETTAVRMHSLVFFRSPIVGNS